MWINMTNHLLIHKVDYSTVQYFLASDKILLVTCNTHVDPLIGAHPKVISLPLGTRHKEAVFEKAKQFYHEAVNKTYLLQISNSGWGDRAYINRIVIAAFNGTVHNTYPNANVIEEKKIRGPRGRKKKAGEAATAALSSSAATTTERRKYSMRRRRLLLAGPRAKGGMLAQRDHYRESAEALFVLCPSGLGFDTYRLWEALVLGSIPIVESNSGLDRTFSSLPVLIIRNYEDLTPELLERAYPCFVEHADKFDFSHLTLRYWLTMIQKAVDTGSIEHVTLHHPLRHKYCDFLS